MNKFTISFAAWPIAFYRFSPVSVFGWLSKFGGAASLLDVSVAVDSVGFDGIGVTIMILGDSVANLPVVGKVLTPKTMQISTVINCVYSILTKCKYN